MTTRTEAIQEYLNSCARPDLSVLYGYDMECQINVAQDGGERVEKEYKGKLWQGWTDGLTTWKPFRIPYKANSEPEYEDRPLSFDLSEHVEAIGMTGWDWVNRVSRWVAFDFDAITGHSDAHQNKLPIEELNKIKDIVKDVDWVTIRKSTSGSGLHLYVFLSPVETANHNEHAALARAILGQLSAFTGYNFCSKVDICGGNMWVWHRKTLRQREGLALIKQGSTLTEIPRNWKDHIKVITGKRHKLSLAKGEENESTFDQLVTRKVDIGLDEDHRAHISWLREQGAVWWWDQDNSMLVTHTKHLKDMHRALGLKGIFDTTTTHSSAQNCFCFPLKSGVWAVRRYSVGVQEHITWEQDGSGWTKCYFNRVPTFETACRTMGGLEDVNGEYTFPEAQCAITALQYIKIYCDIDGRFNNRPAWLKRHKDGRIMFMIGKDARDENSGVVLPGWLVKKDKYLKFFSYQDTVSQEPESNDFDHMLRHIVTEKKEDAGWVIKVNDDWAFEPLTHIKLSLAARGLKAGDISQVLGSAVMNHWYLVNKPFQPEYPGGREWNLDSAKLRFKPSTAEELKYPTWTQVLKHCGKGLDDAVELDPWCKASGVKTGGDYLKCWVASLFQAPTRHLPYLFFYSEEQNTGKTTFYESIAMLLTKGYVKANNALVDKYNGELHGAILCAIEEEDLSSNNKTAYNRIKDWVTAREICIRAMYKEPYHIQNTTHWVQCGNNHSYCPIFPGDTRITMVRVHPLEATEIIPSGAMETRLIKEAPDFLAEIFRMNLPHCDGRLGLPVIQTGEKQAVQASNRNELDEFLVNHCEQCNGNLLKYSEIYDKFIEWCDPDMAHNWTKIRFGKSLPPKYPKGRKRGNSQHYIGNLRWKEDTSIPALANQKLSLSPDGFLDLVLAK